LKIRVGEAEYAVGNGTPVTWMPVKPGIARVYAELDTPVLKLANYTELAVYPMPVNITIEKGSVVIKVTDLLGRPVPGVLYLTISQKRSEGEYYILYAGAVKTNGVFRYSSPQLRGWILVDVEFRGNESYLEAHARKLLYIDYSTPTPLPETPLLSVAVLTVTIVALAVKTIHSSVRRKPRYAG